MFSRIAFGLAALAVSAAPVLAAGVHTTPYDPHVHHHPFGVYFKEEVKVYKPGYGYVVTYHTCYYEKVFDSHYRPFVKKICQ
jgi:hypothetical protein